MSSGRQNSAWYSTILSERTGPAGTRGPYEQLRGQKEASIYTIEIAYQRDVLIELAKRGLRDKIVYMVGGAPTNAEWAKTIGADGWAPDAWEATKTATELLERKRAQRAQHVVKEPEDRLLIIGESINALTSRSQPEVRACKDWRAQEAQWRV